MKNSTHLHAPKTRAITFLFVLVMATLTFLVSCNKDDNQVDEKVSEIAGTWTATSASFNGVDVVDEGGSVTLEIKDNGRFRIISQVPSWRAGCGFDLYPLPEP